MKKRNIFVLIIVLLLVAACGSNDTPDQPPVETNNPYPALGRPTPTPDNAFDFPVPYPGLAPSATPYPEDYPAPPQNIITAPYPADENRVSVIFPVGIQCEDASTGKYQNEQDAEAGLIAAGVTVHSMTTTSLMVCTACSCPTSAHYQAEINASDLNKVIALGWEPGE